MRHKPKYNNMRIVYMDSDEVEHIFYANEVTSNKGIIALLGMPIKEGEARYLTDSDIDFKIDDIIIIGEDIKRITSLPEIRPRQDDNNSRRASTYRKDKVIVTS